MSKTQANLEAALVAHDAFLAGREGARPVVVVANDERHASEPRGRLVEMGGGGVEVVAQKGYPSAGMNCLDLPGPREILGPSRLDAVA